MPELPDSPPFAAIVLAAGASSRLGQPKQLVVYQADTLLRRTARLALAAGASPVVVVIGSGTGAEPGDTRRALAGLPVSVIENPDPSEGMGSSLRAGMAALPALSPRPQSVLLLVCDQPLLRVEDLQALLQASAETGVAAAHYNDRLGVPAVFHRQHFPALAAVTGDQGARTLLRSLPVTPVAMPAAAIDIDTPEDLANLAEA